MEDFYTINIKKPTNALQTVLFAQIYSFYSDHRTTLHPPPLAAVERLLWANANLTLNIFNFNGKKWLLTLIKVILYLTN